MKEQINQWNVIESLLIDPHKKSKQIFVKGPTQYYGAKIVFSTNGIGIIDYPYAKKKKFRHRLYMPNKLTQNGSQV